MNNSSTGNSPDNNSKKNRFTLRRILRAISCVIAAADLPMKGRYRFEVRPIECFGLKGRAISAEFAV